MVELADIQEASGCGDTGCKGGPEEGCACFDQWMKAFCKKITINGAMNLEGTITKPHPDHPDMLNGNSRIFTGLGKWTHIAAVGVANHLKSLGLIESRYIDFNKDGRGWEVWCVTTLGREIAMYLVENDGKVEFRD